MPKRPLSAYNIFFREERQEILGEEVAREFEITDQSKRKHRKTHGKVGFADMARMISLKWKDLSDDRKQPFIERAEKEKQKYLEEVEEWKKHRKEHKVTKDSPMDISIREDSKPRAAANWGDPIAYQGNRRHTLSFGTFSPGSTTNQSLMDISERSILPQSMQMQRPSIGGMSTLQTPQMESTMQRSASLSSGHSLGGHSLPTQSIGGNMMPMSISTTISNEQERLLRLERAYLMHLEKAAEIREEWQRRSNELSQLSRNTMMGNRLTEDIFTSQSLLRQGEQVNRPIDLPLSVREELQYNRSNDPFALDRSMNSRNELLAMERNEMLALQRMQDDPQRFSHTNVDPNEYRRRIMLEEELVRLRQSRDHGGDRGNL
jgi:hypothetical protein